MSEAQTPTSARSAPAGAPAGAPGWQAHPSGSYRYLTGGATYSAGVAAQPGYRIIGVRMAGRPAVAQGFELLDREVARRGLEPSAIAGCRLRSPAQFSFGGFDEFNDTYIELLGYRGLIVDGTNPVARTNVVPQAGPPTEPVMAFGFIVVPDESAPGDEFVVSGAGEVGGSLDPDSIVAAGDVTPDGLKTKSEYVIEQMQTRLTGLGLTGDDPSETNVYTVHPIPSLSERLSAALPGTASWGYRVWFTRPPITGLEFEMDCGRVSSEITL